MTNKEWAVCRSYHTKIIKNILNSGLEMIQQECFPNTEGHQLDAKHRTANILRWIGTVLGNLVGLDNSVAFNTADDFGIKTERMVANVWADGGQLYFKKKYELGQPINAYLTAEQLAKWFDGPNVDKSANMLAGVAGIPEFAGLVD